MRETQQGTARPKRLRDALVSAGGGAETVAVGVHEADHLVQLLLPQRLAHGPAVRARVAPRPSPPPSPSPDALALSLPPSHLTHLTRLAH